MSERQDIYGGTWRVGAAPGVAAVRLSAGLDGVAAVAGDARLSGDLSGLGRGFVSFALDSAAELGSGAEPGEVLAAATSYVATALGSGVQQAAQMSVDAALGSFAQAVPVVGAFVQFAADFVVAVVSGATGQIGGSENLGKNQALCLSAVFEVREGQGTGAYGAVLPADLFMGRTRNDQGLERRDAFWTAQNPGANALEVVWLDERRPHSDGAMAGLLRALEQPAPDIDVSDVWPASAGWRAGGKLTKLRAALRDLREGISAMYADTRVSPPRLWSPGEPTDGGSGLWMVYLDLLDAAFRDGSLSRDYLGWRNLLRPAGGYYGNNEAAAEKFLDAARGKLGVAAKNDPMRYVRGTYGGSSGTPTCAMWDPSPSAVESLAVQWRTFVQSPYSQYKAQLEALGRGPGGLDSLGGGLLGGDAYGRPSGTDVLTAAAFFAALAGGAYYIADPAGASRLARQGIGRARTLAGQAERAARGGVAAAGRATASAATGARRAVFGKKG